MKKEKIIFGSILGVCIVISVGLAAWSFYQSKGPKQQISVVGMTQEDFTSDFIVWDFQFSTQASDIQDANKQIKRQSQVVRSYLKAQGVTDKEMVFQAVDCTPMHRSIYNEKGNYTGSVFVGYQLRQSVSISSSEVDKIEKISRQVTDLLDSNIQIDASNPEYYYTKLADLKVKMLADASDDARLRAETIAKHAGAKLGRLDQANMGVFQITAPNSSDEDYTWGGAFNTSSKEKRATINMRLTYRLK
ncbi:MAG: SIMPL domain-containing protein [Bacteroidales bacterium]|nr:SIMPL domain-containing protein [Bacteroidales bacterium]